MKNLWTKLAASLTALVLTSAVVMAFTQTIDRIGYGSNVPVISSCGTSPSVVGSDLAGTVTGGSASPTTCTITFSAAFSIAPACVVAAVPQLAAFTYTTSTTAIAVTSSASTGAVKYICVGL